MGSTVLKNVFIVILVLLREATGKDLAMVTNILGRGKKKSAPEN